MAEIPKTTTSQKAPHQVLSARDAFGVREDTTVSRSVVPGTLPHHEGVDEAVALPELVPPPRAGLLGRGGMAEVHAARDEPLRREVALKCLLSENEDDYRRRQEFVREARITGQLQHPNIPPIHTLGVDEAGKPFFTMQVIEGRTLREWLSVPERRPGSRERLEEGLEILLKVCDAVSYAHSAGVLHRDIKPDNVMVGLHGRVYLMDWGIALGMGDQERVGAGAICGTPGYMAPEQARGEALDERADVFGVGALLYFVLTGKVPYDRKAGDTLNQAIKGAVVRVSTVAPAELSPRICTIADRAVSPMREDRYGSVKELQDDIRRFLQGGFHLPKRLFAAGEVILQEGDVGDCAFMIIDGACRVTQVVDGTSRELRTMETGDIFGELALLLEGPRTATVVAARPTTLLVIDRQALETSGALHGWSAALLTALARRFRSVEADRR